MTRAWRASDRRFGNSAPHLVIVEVLDRCRHNRLGRRLQLVCRDTCTAVEEMIARRRAARLPDAEGIPASRTDPTATCMSAATASRCSRSQASTSPVGHRGTSTGLPLHRLIAAQARENFRLRACWGAARLMRAKAHARRRGGTVMVHQVRPRDHCRRGRSASGVGDAVR